MRLFPVLLLLTLVPQLAEAAEITRIWLTHTTNEPSKVVVNWMTDEPGDSVVRFGLTAEYGETVRIDENTTLHHVEIPLKHRDTIYHYSVSTGDQRSSDATFKAYPTDVLRVAVVADWQGKPDLSAIVKDNVHLLLTAGDNIARLWDKCGEGRQDCIEPYAGLIDAYPELFRSTPFMPVLGNHDREIRPRGNKPPAEPVYDVDATAFRRFFELPGDEWKWHFEVPEFDLRFVALDFNHISDVGTTWQTCHPFDENSEQFRWYKKLMEQPPGFVVTLHNERNASLRNQAQKQWHDLCRRGTCCITGFGYYAERADPHGLDTCWAGIVQMWTGEVTGTYTEEGIYRGAKAAGMSEENARLTGMIGDAGIGIGFSYGSGYVSSPSAVASRVSKVEAARLIDKGYTSGATGAIVVPNWLKPHVFRGNSFGAGGGGIDALTDTVRTSATKYSSRFKHGCAELQCASDAERASVSIRGGYSAVRTLHTGGKPREACFSCAPFLKDMGVKDVFGKMEF